MTTNTTNTEAKIVNLLTAQVADLPAIDMGTPDGARAMADHVVALWQTRWAQDGTLTQHGLRWSDMGHVHAVLALGVDR